MQESDSIIDHLFEDEKLTDKQKKIIEAAIDSFSEKGYSGTSTSEIAKKAGVAEGTIFRHYKTKKDLLLSIIAPMLAKSIAPFVIKDLYKILDTKYDSYEGFLRAMIANRYVFLKHNLPLFKILIQEIPFHPELKEQFMEHIAKKVYTRFESLVVYFQEKEQIINIPPASVIRFNITTIMGYFFTRYLFFPDADWNDDEEIEITIQFLLHGLSPLAKKEDDSP
ncbi:TetR/AcrR family transcriptional regulator [Cytobacillus purgationiresistens]|uniref:AcrR family transcriptional regulator n=1 Tax=Cytobacillus purgationiresistens TaxID=863449 RepID=A0ABU0AKK8_9BACI|nr:TetR/AcrR family transcriptional regulator [Cytobacillus purgationiresistens]MDQ0271812.1 AcrR family transcriptional regulator [Cytobacillus purgationiresistens]